MSGYWLVSVSVSVYYVAVRTIVLSRHGSNLARPVIIHGLMCQILHVVDFLGSRRMETAPTSIEVLLRPTQSQSDEPSDLRGSLSPTSVYSTWQSQAVTHHPRRCLTSVIEHKPLSERHIPYSDSHMLDSVLKNVFFWVIFYSFCH